MSKSKKKISKEVSQPSPISIKKIEEVMKLVDISSHSTTSLPSKRKSKERNSVGSTYSGSRLGLILMCRDEFKSKFTQEILYKWRKVQIISVSGKRNEIIRVHFLGWPDKYDFTLNLDTDFRKLAPLYLLSVNVELKGYEISEEEAECTLRFLREGKYDTSKNKSWPLNDGKIIFEAEAYLDVLDIFLPKGSNVQMFKWRRAKIISITGTKILINYIGWDSRYNETLDIEEDSHRFSPFGTKSVEDLSRTMVKDKLSQNNYISINNVESESSNIDTSSSDHISKEEQLIIKMDEEEILKEKEFIQILVKNGLHVIEIEGDGNCLFRAVSYQVFGNEDNHELLREKVVIHLKNHRDRFKLFCADNYDEHIQKISQLGEWGDDLEVRALEEIMDRNILIYSSGNPDPLSPVNYNEEEAKLLEGVKPILLSYHGYRHYNSIYKDNDQIKDIRNSNLLLSVRMKLFGQIMSSPDRPDPIKLSNITFNNSHIQKNFNNNISNLINSKLPPNFPLPSVQSNTTNYYQPNSINHMNIQNTHYTPSNDIYHKQFNPYN